jgi:hypothetical protein
MTRMTLIAILTMSLASAGCAMVKVYPASPGDKPKGARVYPPKVYLMVDENVSELVTLPDLCRPYDLAPLTIVAKQDFKVEVSEGQLEAFTANQDTTAFPSFLSDAAELAAKSAGAGVSSKKLAGNFGLAEGIYEFADDGTLKLLNGRVEKCKGWTH